MCGKQYLVYQMGVNLPADIASGRIAEVRSRSMSCNCMTRTAQQECRGILEIKKTFFRKTWGKEEKENNEIGLHKKFY